jgi:MYXO-CTERM domain-containing protein
MRRTRYCQGLELAVVLVILGSVSTSSHADPITIPGYTITDLGAGTPTFSTDANGNGILNAPNGQIYAFPQTPNTVLTPGQGIMANFSYGNQQQFGISAPGPIMNANGIVAAANVPWVQGEAFTGDVYYVQHNKDGSWGQPTVVWTGDPQVFEPGVGFSIWLSKANEILINNFGTTEPNINHALLYNINTHTLTDLFSLLSSAGLQYFDLVPSAIDDDGQILLATHLFNPSLGPIPDNILLTPIGVSSDPLEVPAPEPGTLAMALLAIAGFAAHRLHERRRAA